MKHLNPPKNDGGKRPTSLRRSIYLGFSVIILILIINGVFTMIGLGSSMKSFDRYRRLNETNHALTVIDRDVQELNRRVTEFVFTGDSSHQVAAQSLATELQRRIERLLPAVEAAATRDTLGSMQSHLREYARQFESVIEERQLRTDLVQRQLVQQGERVHQQLEELASDYLSRDSRQRLELLSAQQLFSMTEIKALRYFSSLDSRFVNAALRANASAQKKIHRFSSTGMDDDRFHRLLESLDQYERICLRAVQATRGYLYLVSVVMAGEASEFAYYSSQLKHWAEETRQQVRQQTIAVTRRTRQTVGLVLVLGLLAALYSSGRLAYTIIHPITALTDTFRRLTAGETLLAIPGTDRRDEIGKMALAAEVFKQKNRQTEDLLENSQRLGFELTEKAIELENINAELDNFAYVASHDLRSPLRGIHQLASWICEDAADVLPPTSREHLGKLQSRISRMETMLQDLLEYSRVGRCDETIESVDLATMLSDITTLIDNPHKIAIRWQEDLPDLATVRIPLEQVFLNLITNAVKHHDKRSDGTIDIGFTERDDFIEFRVQDNGPGIPASQHRRIFQLYQRVGDPAVEGCGMGLSIVKKQVETRGGQIRVESTVGEGTRFVFTWPKSTPRPETALSNSDGENHATKCVVTVG